jgi:hypothetical protein
MTTETLTPKQVAFEIGFALGQTGAQTLINCYSKSPEVWMKAIALLTEQVAARFAKMTMLQEVPDYEGPLFGAGEVAARKRCVSTEE